MKPDAFSVKPPPSAVLHGISLQVLKMLDWKSRVLNQLDDYKKILIDTAIYGKKGGLTSELKLLTLYLLPQLIRYDPHEWGDAKTLYYAKKGGSG